MVGIKGLEPIRLATQKPKSCASANFAISPYGVDNGIWTHTPSLEDWYATIKHYTHMFAYLHRRPWCQLSAVGTQRFHLNLLNFIAARLQRFLFCILIMQRAWGRRRDSNPHLQLMRLSRHLSSTPLYVAKRLREWRCFLCILLWKNLDCCKRHVWDTSLGLYFNRIFLEVCLL